MNAARCELAFLSATRWQTEGTSRISIFS